MFNVKKSIFTVTICLLAVSQVVAEEGLLSSNEQKASSIEYIDLQSEEFESKSQEKSSSDTHKKATKGAAKLKAELSQTKSKKQQDQANAWSMGTKKEISMKEVAKRMVQGLAICLGVMFLVLAVIKRTKKGVIKTKSHCKIIEKMPLTAKSTLILVEINGKQHAITVGSEQVQQVQLLQHQQQPLKNESRPVRREKEGLELLCHIGNIF